MATDSDLLTSILTAIKLINDDLSVLETGTSSDFQRDRLRDADRLLWEILDIE